MRCPGPSALPVSLGRPARLAGSGLTPALLGSTTGLRHLRGISQMEEEGVPSTALREVSLLQMLSESIYVVRCCRDSRR